MHEQVLPHLPSLTCLPVHFLLLFRPLTLCQVDCTPVKLVQVLLYLRFQIHHRPLLPIKLSKGEDVPSWWIGECPGDMVHNNGLLTIVLSITDPAGKVFQALG